MAAEQENTRIAAIEARLSAAGAALLGTEKNEGGADRLDLIERSLKEITRLMAETIGPVPWHFGSHFKSLEERDPEVANFLRPDGYIATSSQEEYTQTYNR